MSGGPEVPAYRQPSRLATPKWQDDANCNDKDPALWELGPEDLDAEVQQELIAEGLKICSTCPVAGECLSTASPLDRYWSSRGGRPPEGLFPDSKRPKYVSPITLVRKPDQVYKGRKPPEKCKLGHDDWKPRANGTGRYCATCVKLRWRAKSGKLD